MTLIDLPGATGQLTNGFYLATYLLEGKAVTVRNVGKQGFPHYVWFISGCLLRGTFKYSSYKLLNMHLWIYQVYFQKLILYKNIQKDMI
jgi:hypothetical protein